MLLNPPEEKPVVEVARRVGRSMRPEFREAKRLAEARDLLVAGDVLRVHKVGVGIQPDDIGVMITRIVVRSRFPAVWAVNPDQIIETFCAREIIKHVPPEFYEFFGLLSAPPEPTAVHLMEWPPHHHDAGGLELLQAGGHLVKFVHPARVRSRGGVK